MVGKNGFVNKRLRICTRKDGVFWGLFRFVLDVACTGYMKTDSAGYVCFIC